MSLRRFFTGRQSRQAEEDTRNRDRSGNFRECIPIRGSEGNVVDVLDTKTGKLGKPRSGQERLAFNPVTGKLGVITQPEGTDDNSDFSLDNEIQLGMADDGFFNFIMS